MKNYRISDGCAMLLILLFIYTGFSKLFDYDMTREQMAKSPFIFGWSGIVAWLVPVTEIIISIALYVKQLRVYAFHASVLLMSMFTSYVYAMLHFSYYLPCSCGGVLSALDWNTHLWFNIAFLVIAVVGSVVEIKAGSYQQHRLTNVKMGI
ncbi:MauE/DoxX family redox-associated membrane protein [Filimonas effusa]|uniref:Methylamine utilisation protein MauE domain-containing protein n=1 Tax=Filimonas effusa TaxID=2508721 RepID=A0A4Q1D307_9BACT|nr:MauE/DoxX family redox-associated membrane protein [Filimonas effusa]RXK81679.1 hypothetical protein ESB13_17945 [Filimonas effusa]